MFGGNGDPLKAMIYYINTQMHIFDHSHFLVRRDGWIVQRTGRDWLAIAYERA